VAQRIDVDEVIRLLEDGARLFDVLPHSIYVQEHLPSAENLPLETFSPEQVEEFDRGEPVITYCFDQHCDLSSRAARRLELEGFTKVNDLIGGRAAWTALGLPTEGVVADRRRIGNYTSTVDVVAPTATIGDVRALDPRFPVAIVDDGILVGAIAHSAADLPDDTPVRRAMVPAPATIRSETRVEDAIRQLRKDDLAEIFVTTVSGALFGIVRPDELAG
jgi:rhodanese-related sulfurtransferase